MLAAETAPLEVIVKATFLFKFQLYVTWPPRAFRAAASPFNICIVGRHPFGSIMDRVVRGQDVAGHVMSVVRLDSVSTGANCQVMYIGTDDPRVVIRQLAAEQHQPVLTVTDQMQDSDAKGIINFVIVDNQVRFEIDNAEALRSGLSISSKLLALAVRTPP